MKGLNYQDNNNVKFLADGIWINGTPRIILCSSVFYFRIPRDEWRDRLEKVKAAGYNCIETYVPWNYHETEEANWDFEGEKDVASFFALAAELGLWVIARPGPYICSEWDMGALPAYLLSKEDLVLREYNELYLDYVKRWYDKIMPIIMNYQLGKQGTVIAVQIENELDFYDCKQIELYIATLRDYALEFGIEVPIIVCAGQCDIVRAGGLVDGVLATINLYPEIQDMALEDRINHYAEVLRDEDIPLCITETTQSHFILRRELIAGAKLIAPYNQVGGTDFGFTTAVNNWGTPLSYLPHEYTLKGMINPYGEGGSEYEEAFLLTGLIRSLEDKISRGFSCEETELNIIGECKLSSGINRTLHLKAGGKLAAIANIDEKAGKVHFRYGGKTRPTYTELIVKPARCPIFPFDLPLIELGMIKDEGRLAYSTAEIGSIKHEDGNVSIMLYTDHEAEVSLCLTNPIDISYEGMELYRENDMYTFTFTAAHGAFAKLLFENNKVLSLYAISREEAIRKLMDSRVEQYLEEDNTEILNTMQGIRYHKRSLPTMGIPVMDLSKVQMLQTGEQCLAMEDMQYYRGYGWYEGKVTLAHEQKQLGYMIYRGMDILHLYRNNEYIDSFIGDGTHKFIKEPKAKSDNIVTLGVRCEIWGHSNFSDSRLPAIDIRSKKGIKGLAVIHNIEDITENWCYCKNEVPKEQCALLTEQDKYRPRISFGTYNNPEQPQIGVYKKKLKLQPGCNAIVLELKEMESFGKVYVDGDFVMEVQPHFSTVTLDHVSGKQEIELAIYFEMKIIQESPKLKIYFYEGQHVTDMHCYGADEKQLSSYVTEEMEPEIMRSQTTELKDVELLPGEVSLFSGNFTTKEDKRSLKIRVTGKDAKVLVLLNGIMIGRLWFTSKVKPDFRGGDESVLHLPKGFMREENQLDLLVEALQGEPKIKQVLFEVVRNR